MKKLFIYLFIAFPSLASSQTLSLEELWRRIEQTNRYQQEELKVRLAQEELVQDKIDRLPLFYADANLQRNLIIPTTPVPAIAFDPNAKDGAIIPLQFATKWSSKAGVQLEWNIFNPKNSLNHAQNKLNLEKAKLQQKEQIGSLKKEATLTYASIVLATLQYNKARKDSVTYAEILQVTRDRYEQGRISSSEYVSAQQEMERKKIQIFESWSVLAEASIELRNSLDIQDIRDVSSDIQAIQSALENYSNQDYQRDILQVEEQLATLQIQQLRKQRLPSLTFNSYLGTQFFNNSLTIGKSENWFGNSFANLALRIPISDYVWQNPQLKKAAWQQKINSLRVEEQVITDRTNDEQLAVKKLAAKQKIASLEHIYTLAEQHQKEKYEAYINGRILVSVYNKATLDLHKAQQDIWQAQYDYISILLN